MGMEHHVGVGVDDGVGKFYGEWAEQASLKLPLKLTLHTNSGRQSDTCFRTLWQIPMLCSTKLWKQRIVQPKLNGHGQEFVLLLWSLLPIRSRLLSQKTTYIMCFCSHLMLITHLNEAARNTLGWPGALEVEGSIDKGRINIVKQIYVWKRAFILPICSWYYKELSKKSTSSSNSPTVHSMITQKRKGVQEEDLQVNASAKCLCWNHTVTKLKGLEKWKEMGENFL